MKDVLYDIIHEYQAYYGMAMATHFAQKEAPKHESTLKMHDEFICDRNHGQLTKYDRRLDHVGTSVVFKTTNRRSSNVHSTSFRTCSFWEQCAISNIVDVDVKNISRKRNENHLPDGTLEVYLQHAKAKHVRVEGTRNVSRHRSVPDYVSRQIPCLVWPCQGSLHRRAQVFITASFTARGGSFSNMCRDRANVKANS